MWTSRDSGVTMGKIHQMSSMNWLEPMMWCVQLHASHKKKKMMPVEVTKEKPKSDNDDLLETVVSCANYNIIVIYVSIWK